MRPFRLPQHENQWCAVLCCIPAFLWSWVRACVCVCVCVFCVCVCVCVCACGVFGLGNRQTVVFSVFWVYMYSMRAGLSRWKNLRARRVCGGGVSGGRGEGGGGGGGGFWPKKMQNLGDLRVSKTISKIHLNDATALTGAHASWKLSASSTRINSIDILTLGASCWQSQTKGWAASLHWDFHSKMQTVGDLTVSKTISKIYLKDATALTGAHAS